MSDDRQKENSIICDAMFAFSGIIWAKDIALSLLPVLSDELGCRLLVADFLETRDAPSLKPNFVNVP